MNRLSLSSMLLIAAASAVSLPAAADTAIPEKVRQHLLKRHPQASDLQTVEETHFGNKLLKVSYKDNDELNMELFKSNGALFTNVMPIEDPTPLSQDLLKTLKTEFPDYQFKKGEMVANPNGTGEEYALYLVANGVNWLVTINEKGQLLSKSNF